jgi:IS5 family transposase
VRQRDDLLAPITRLAAGRSLATRAPRTLATAAGCWADRLGAGVSGLGQRSGSRGGEQTGPNPTDRAKLGCKRHIVVDRNGIPLAVVQSAANVHDNRMVEATVDAIPLLRLPGGHCGRPRRRPKKLHAGKGYDYRRCRQALRRRGITPRIARRGVESSERLGRYRWVVERTLSWLNRLRRLKVRYERRADIHEAFLLLGCALICWKSLSTSSGAS